MTTKATPAQVAQFGHIAARIRALLKERKWKPIDLAKELDMPKGNPQVYNWIHSKSGVGPKYRAKLAELCGCNPMELVERKSGVPAPNVSTVTYIPPTKTQRILSFEVHSDQTATIKFDVTLPTETAMPLLRMLFDAGVVFDKLGNGGEK